MAYIYMQVDLRIIQRPQFRQNFASNNKSPRLRKPQVSLLLGLLLCKISAQRSKAVFVLSVQKAPNRKREERTGLIQACQIFPSKPTSQVKSVQISNRVPEKTKRGPVMLINILPWGHGEQLVKVARQRCSNSSCSRCPHTDTIKYQLTGLEELDRGNEPCTGCGDKIS